jgi:hypothetical protein
VQSKGDSIQRGAVSGFDCIFFMLSRSIQNATVQRMHVEILCILVWITYFQSYVTYSASTA